MGTGRKTKKQLVDEMAELRRKVVSLEKIIREHQESEITELQRRIGQYVTGCKQVMDAYYVIFDGKCKFVNQTFDLPPLKPVQFLC
jgi:hypothetical protein